MAKRDGRVVVYAMAITWAGAVPDAYHWIGTLVDSETGIRQHSDGFEDKSDALQWAIDLWFALYDYDQSVLVVGRKSDQTKGIVHGN